MLTSLVLSWSPLQSGVSNSFMSQPAPAVVYSLSYDPVAGKAHDIILTSNTDFLYVGGLFTSASSLSTKNFARFRQKDTWNSLLLDASSWTGSVYFSTAVITIPSLALDNPPAIPSTLALSLKIAIGIGAAVVMIVIVTATAVAITKYRRRGYIEIPDISQKKLCLKGRIFQEISHKARPGKRRRHPTNRSS